jgi:hypothetical protein
MSKKKKQRPLSAKEELFALFAAGRIHSTVRVVAGEERLILARFDQTPLPPRLREAAILNKPELIELVKHNGLKVCIAPADPTHQESVREDAGGRRFCHACATYRQVSEQLYAQSLQV